MIRRRGGEACGNKRLVAHLLGVSTSVVFVCGTASFPASADVEPPRAGPADGSPVTDDVRNGNGGRNHNIFSMKSPTNNHGYQHTSTSTAGGRTSVYNAMCRYVTFCTITRRVGPRRTKPVTRSNVGAFASHSGEKAGAKPYSSVPRMNTFFYAGPLGFMMGSWIPAASPGP
jgi:hypothetical protein